MKRPELLAWIGAVALHALLAAAMIVAPLPGRPTPRTVEIDVRAVPPPPPPPPPVAPLRPPPPAPPVRPPPPPPPKSIARPKAPPPSPPKAPIPNETPKTPPKPTAEPPKPVFGVTASSTTTGESSFSVPVGNTTVTDPKNTAPKAEPLPAAPAGTTPGPPTEFRPTALLEVGEPAEQDEASCQIPEQLYPREAREQRVEGETLLSVDINEQGKVVGVRIVSGPLKELNELGARWMRTRCRWKPARNKKKQPVPVRIRYTFDWKLAD